MIRFPTVKVAFRALAANKVRAALTMLGVIIGVGAVVAMVSLGAGASYSVSSRIEGLGSNLITVVPGPGGFGGGARQAVGSGASLTLADSHAIADSVAAVTQVSPELGQSTQVIYGNRNINATITGVTPSYEQVRNAAVDVGRFIDETDSRTSARVAVVGANVVEELFGGGNPVGQWVKMSSVPVQVVGVLAAKGGAGPVSPDDGIFVPLSTAQNRLFGVDNLRQIGVQVSETELMDQAAQEITALLLDRHEISDSEEADFRVLNQQDLLETVGQVTGTMTLLLGGIASVSLLVGGIGIMNIMLVSVTERTREIGLRKAVGARRRDILKQFLIESVMISLTGGVIGALLGIGGSRAVSVLADFTTVVSAGSVLLAVAFAAAVGVFFGIFPAMRAARLNPIDALRYE